MSHAFSARGLRRALGALFGAAVLLSATALHAEGLALKRVVLSSGGLGYFEYEAEVEGDARLKLTVALDQVDDVLKSIVVYDDKGGVGGLDLPSREPLAATFRDLPFQAEDLSSTDALLRSLRGAEIVVGGARALAGRIVAVAAEPQLSPEGRQTGARHRVTVMSDKGLQNFVLEDAESVKFADQALQAQIDRALGALADNHQKDSRTLQLVSKGAQKRMVRVAYLTQAPVWKASYRLVLPEDPNATTAKLQGWATLENLSGQDWKDVDLTLVSGQPVTYRQQLYRPYLVERPEAPIEVVGRLLPNLDEGSVTPGAAKDRRASPGEPNRPAPASAPIKEKYDQRQAIQFSGGTSAFGDAPRQVAETADTIVAQEGLTQVAFHLPAPVSVEKGRTLSIPIIDGAAHMERFGYYQSSVSANHPLATVKLTNDGGSGMPPGIVTIYEQDAGGVSFVGDSRLSDLPRGDFRLLSYALDLKTIVERSEDHTSKLVLGAIAKGVLKTDTLISQSTIFHIKSTEKHRLILETSKLEGWTLAAPAADGVTEANGRYRIPVQVEAADGQTLVVTQQRHEVQTLALRDMDVATVGEYAKASDFDPKTREKLVKLADLRVKLADAQRALAKIDAKVDEIERDGSRLRDLLQVATNGSDLQKRYLAKLDSEETQIETLRASRAEADKAQAEAQSALEDYILNL
jgi:hypothetical protein